MSPYIAVSVYGYQPGDVVPDADEAMLEVGAVELADEATAPEPDADDIKSLREAAKAAGINSFGKSKAELRELLGVT